MQMGLETYNQWEEVMEIIENHDFPTKEKARELLPFDDQDDLKKSMEITTRQKSQTHRCFELTHKK
jgi:hypothetical protein